ncbi:MAG: flavodoxin family protein [bacterium]
MDKILSINFSHRMKGNSDSLLSLVEKSINKTYSDKELKRLNIKDLDIKNCIGCMSCAINNNFCFLEDDFKQFTDEISACDSLIIASPVYFLGAPSSLKALIDRMLYYHNIIDFANPKPAKIIITAGRNGWLGNVVEEIARFLLSSGFYLNDLKIFYAQGPSEVLLTDNISNEIELFTKEMFRKKTVQNPSAQCPLCKTDKFAITGQNQIKCSICDIKGEIISYENNRALILFDESDINNSRWEYNNLKQHMVEWVEKSGLKYKSRVRDILKIRKQLLS